MNLLDQQMNSLVRQNGLEDVLQALADYCQRQGNQAEKDRQLDSVVDHWHGLAGMLGKMAH